MLRAAYVHGQTDALKRLGVKSAAFWSRPPAALPTARVVAPGSGVRTPVAAPPASAPAAPSGAVDLPPLPHPAIAAARALPGKMMRPVGRALGLGALGAAGALAYGVHRQNVEDREKNPLIYAPMQGTVMG